MPPPSRAVLPEKTQFDSTGLPPLVTAMPPPKDGVAAWSTVLSGGGINGGQVVGATSDDGVTVKDRPISVPDLLATICGALGVDHTEQNMSNVGRPVQLVDFNAKPIQEVLS